MITFIVLSTVLLAIGFCVGWPLLQVARSKVERWHDAPGSRKFVWSGVLLAIAGIGIAVGMLDIFVNYAPASILFQCLPAKGDIYLTNRIQRILNEISEQKRPDYVLNWFQWGYVKIVVKIANRIDKTPHFRIPDNLVNYFQ